MAGHVRFRVLVPFCGAFSAIDACECIGYKPSSSGDGSCAYADDITGIYDGQSHCRWDPDMLSNEDSENKPSSTPSDLAAQNAAILAKNGITPTSEGVKFHPDSLMWIISLKHKHSPWVDFCAAKNKWKDVKKQKMYYGDANQLITYLRSGGKQGGSTDPNKEKSRREANR
jgi:hypothetical protein